MKGRLLVAVLVVASCAALAAQTPPRYDRAAEQPFLGVITGVASFPAADGAVGVHLDVKAPDGTLMSVHVAPALFIGENNFWFYVDDKIQVVGSKMTVEGNTSVWARVVMKGAETMVLRGEDGTPKWKPAIDGTDGCGIPHIPLAKGTER